jgi:hypothetical protein
VGFGPFGLVGLWVFLLFLGFWAFSIKFFVTYKKKKKKNKILGQII